MENHIIIGYKEGKFLNPHESKGKSFCSNYEGVNYCGVQYSPILFSHLNCQGNEESIVIEADENLLELIKTEVKDNELRIYAEKNIGYAASKKIMVTFKEVSKITSTSGSDVISTNTITADYLELKSSSGSDMKLSVNTTTLDCNSSSGSDIKISGNTEKLVADASSGSDIKASKLMAVSSQVKATSGADITVNTAKELTADANSGGDIKYYGNPDIVNKTDSHSGSISKQ